MATGETLPTDATFASVAFATHESTVSYFNAGDAASAELTAFAETGSTDLVVEEFAAQPHSSNVYPKKTKETSPQGATAAQTFEFHRASRGQDHLTFATGETTRHEVDVSTGRQGFSVIGDEGPGATGIYSLFVKEVICPS